jgi:HYR domain/GEVED domain/Domain of unknown function DUF11/Secretion system C-terminal sorting domain/Leucine rich repeat
MTSFKPSFSVTLWLPLSPASLRDFVLLNIFMFFSGLVFGQTLPEANLIKDINVGNVSSAPNNFISFNGKTYFKATPVTGSLSKIMVTDGTDVGTTVAGFSPTNVSLFSDMVLFNNQIYWLAEQAGSITLWKTADGNSATLIDTIASAKADTTYNLNNNFNTQPFVANNNLVLHYVKHYAPFSYDTDLHYYAYSNGLKGGTRNVGLGEKRYIGTVTPSNSSFKFLGNNNIFFVNLVENYSNGYYTIELKSNFNTNQIIANNYSVFGAPPRNINLVGLGTINDNFIGVFNDSLVNITAQGQKTVLKTGCSEIEFLAQINNQIYFRINYRDIFRTDGTASGTIQIPTSNISLSVKMKINDTLFVASSNNEDRYEIWKIDNSKTDFQRVFLLEGPKLGILTYAINNKIFMGNNVGNKTTLYEPDFSRNKLRMLGQIDRLNQLGSIQSGSILVASSDNDQTVAINTNVKGIELKSLNLNPSVVQYPCLADTIKPQWYSCPNNFIISQPQGFCIGTVLERPNAFDNCGIPITAVKAIKGSFIPDSQWNNGKPSYNLCPYDVYDTITYYARDLSYNVGQCSFTAIARLPNPCSSDITPPTFARCPLDTIINANQPTIVNWTTPAVSDNCGIPSLGVNYASGSTFPMGVTRVIYTATDVANNTAVCSFNVTVSNPTNPVNCASNAQSPWNEWIKEVKIDTFTNASEKVRSDRYAVGYSDFKDKIIPLKQGQTYTSTMTPGISYPSYQSNLFFSAWIDFNGNNIFEDNERILGASAYSNVVGGTFLVPTTAKLGNTVLRISMKKDSWASPCETFAAGEVEDYTVNILANNNCDTDTTPPFYYNCPENITLTTTGTTAVATWVTPTATDNCGTPSVLSDYNSGFGFPLGTTVVTYTFADAKGNKRTCNFNVNVTNSNPCLNDAIPPVLSNCPTNISLTTTGTTANATWTAPTATDNCSTPSVSSTYNSGFAFPIGLTTVSYTATDAKGNTAKCSFNVTVTQQSSNSDICTNPTANVVGGSGSITITGITTSSAAIQVFTSTWNSVYNQQVTGTSATIPNLAVGKYIVKVTVLGTGGRWPAVCNVQVENVSVTSGTNPCATDVTPPNFTNCPTNISLTTTGTTSIATWTAPTATDNCGTPSVLSNYNSGFAFPLGTTAVTYTATDAKGNKATCNFNVVVAQSLSCRQRDSLSLVDVYNSMGGANWVNKWDLSKSMNTWIGVATDSNGCVLALTPSELVGNLSPSIGNLSQLKYMRLGGSQAITGTIPNSFANLSNLVELQLEGNKMTGNIPDFVGNLLNLEQVLLYSNKFTGSIPSSFGNLKKLRTLILNNNLLSGDIPSSMSNMTALTSLELSNNSYTSISEVFGTIKRLYYLGLDNNKLTNSIPKNLAELTEISVLKLSNNLLTGCIPIELKALCGKDVDLSNNPNLLGGGNWAAFCSSNTGICPTITNDLELSMTSNPSVFKKWTTINTTVSIKNIGNQAYTNIEINVPAPKGTSAGGTGLPTIGTWQPYCSGGVLCYKWTIPSLAANATATLTIPLFVLNVDTAIVATAKLMTSLPVDNNASNNTANVTIAPAPTQQIAALSVRKPTQYIPVIIQKISPNPTDGDVYIDVESLDERDMRFEFFNAQGQNVYNEMQHLKKGSNQLYFNITDKESGLYFVKLETSGGRNVPVKFVKL